MGDVDERQVMRRRRSLTQEGSLITEEMRKAVGVESAPAVVEIEKETIRRVADAANDPNPLWRDEEYAKKTRHGGIIAFPIALHPGSRTNRPPVQYQSPARAGGLAGDEWEFLEPIRPGDKITLTTHIADFFEREGARGKALLTVTQTTYKNQHGRVVMIAKRTNLAYPPAPQKGN